MRSFILSVLMFGVMVLTSICNADPISTLDWERREAFVDPEKTNETVLETATAGQWSHKGLSGIYRFVVTQFEGNKERLYVQWVRDNGEAAYSISVVELNKVPEYDLSLPKCVNEVSCSEVLLSGVHTYEKDTRQFRLRLDGLGSYVFQFVTR